MNNTTVILPPILILGIDTPIGLTLIRELGERNVSVYGIAGSAGSIGLASRHLTKGYIHIGNDDELVDLINQISESHNVHFLMTVSEQRIVFLQQNLHRLKNITPLIPDATAMQAVLNKDEIYELAKGIGINTPINYSTINDSTPEHIKFPVILKWANPTTTIPLLNKHKIPFLKCEYCYSRDELISALARYQPIGEHPLIQSYCPGYGLGQMIYLHQDEPVLCFQHKRIHEWPPEGGFSTLCESVDTAEHQELFQQSIDLLRAIKWEGPAMVEYRFNPKTREAVLMEINGRFWGSLPLAYNAKAHFGWTHYSVQVLGRIPNQPNILAGLRCMFFIPEMKRLITVVFRKKSIQDKTLHYNALEEIYIFINHYIKTPFFYVFNWRDPRPFFWDVFNSILKSLPRFGH